MYIKQLFIDGIIIVAILVALVPIANSIYGLMNSPTDLAYIGPILWFCVMAFSMWLIIERIKSISNVIKQHNEWKIEKKVTGKSSKKKENKKN